ncbi:IucA/IucC family protein [Microbulbifer sp. TRSA001]|uniref:IucA/IucC family protein n=1 Tax=Microbulbifer sp. TRSA001 TaxID=3243381 RepID=UPI0040392533
MNNPDLNGASLGAATGASDAHSMNPATSERPANMTAEKQKVKCSAERLSANCFFNALLRETNSGQWYEHSDTSFPEGIKAPAVCVSLPETGTELWLNVIYRSECGRHQFELPIVWRQSSLRSQVVSMAECARLIADDPAFFPGAGEQSRQVFADRVQASVRNMTQALQARNQDMERLFGEVLSFGESEQALLCGHSIHPTPKSREPFTDRDAECFAPEFGNSFSLMWLGVDPQFLSGASGAQESADQLADLVRETDGVSQPPKGFVAIPAHPWQWQQLQRDHRITQLLESGSVVELGLGSGAWRATSSLRAVYSAESSYMLKFSLSLRLTNSVRTLQPKEMTRGLEVLKVRETPIGQDFAQRYPNFQVLAEPAYLMLADQSGNPVIESLVMFRENPFVGEAAENTCLLATLTQDHPDAESCRAAQLISQLAKEQNLSSIVASKLWFDAFVDAVIEPLLIAQADFGILFGAHQQNLILRFDGPMPVAGYFRDCQGSGYSYLGEELLKPYLPNLAQNSENVVNEEMANRLFVYYLIVNSCFGLISAVAAAGLVSERDLLNQLRDRVQKLYDGQRRDRSGLEYLLQSEQIWAKGNFQCAVIGMNENTSDDPLSIYHSMINPLKETEEPSPACSDSLDCSNT